MEILIDLYCGVGGAAEGYRRVGFHVIGVDIAPQPRYIGDEFIQGDALETLQNLLVSRRGIVGIHASPTCQRHTALRTIEKRDYPEQIAPTREALKRSGLPYVIENVLGSPLIDPVVLCGSMFGNRAGKRQLRRHRLFESSFPIPQPECNHMGQPIGVYGGGTNRKSGEGRGHKGTADECREAMEMPWATKKEVVQAIPPSYTQHIGQALLAHLST